MELLRNKKIVNVLLMLICSIFLANARTTLAAVYKWTDAQGKVHYSDKKVDDKASEQTVSVGSMPKARIIAVAQPVKYKSDHLSKVLSVTEVGFALSNEERTRLNNISFYFGGDCVSPSSISFDEFQRRFRKSLESGYELQKSSMWQLTYYGYRNIYFHPDDPKRQIDNNEGYLLRLDIIGIKINGCVPRLRTPQDSGALDKFGFSSYEKSNVWLRLKWSVENPTGEKIFASGFSDGSANDIDGQDASINLTFKAAYDNSFINALASPEFVSAVNFPDSIAGAAANLGALPRTDAQAESEAKATGLSALPGKFNNSYIARANFAKALILVNPLRVSISEYYATHDQWPIYFSDIDVDSKNLHEPGVVDSVSLRVGGRLYVKLAEEAFGPKQYFELIPNTSRQTMIDWVCKTTLEKVLWAGSCTGY